MLHYNPGQLPNFFLIDNLLLVPTCLCLHFFSKKEKGDRRNWACGPQAKVGLINDIWGPFATATLPSHSYFWKRVKVRLQGRAVVCLFSCVWSTDLQNLPHACQYGLLRESLMLPITCVPEENKYDNKMRC